MPFAEVVGQESMKAALMLNAINPAIGGVLIRGERGTAKSTAVRALPQLLPEVEVVSGCRYSCDPAQPQRWCDECAMRAVRGEVLRTARRRVRVLELPLNASEDRVVGAIDVEAAIKRGEKVFEPGLLAEANRGIVYVDEVNLLDDHIVDVLLDAAAMGENVVQREGVAVSHPARFILVGTMNPDEGELRPQLLDRFGLCVDVRGLRDLEDRVSVMTRDAERELGGYVGAQDSDDHLRAVVARARELLPLVELSPQLRWFVALVCIDARAYGHRADIVVSSTARTLCAMRAAELLVPGGAPDSRPAPLSGGALRVTTADVMAAADLALAHRRHARLEQGVPAPSRQGEEHRQERYDEMAREATAAVSEAAPAEADEAAAEEELGETGETPGDSQGIDGALQPVAKQAAEQHFEGTLFPVRKIALPRDRKTRSASGKRSSARSSDKRGRYVRAVQTEKTSDIALDATMRAAAPHQIKRRLHQSRAEGAPALHLERQDLRQKVRRRKTGTLIVFVVDASASMDAEQRMQATKGAVLSLLRDAYVRRDKVALIVFSGRTARVVLQPTSSVDLAEERLQRLTVGGTTPLTHGLVAGLKLIRTERVRDSGVYPLLVLISDGRGNISLFGEEPLTEAQALASQLGAEHIHTLVIDSARDHSERFSLPRVPTRNRTHVFGGYGFNACLDLAERSGGEYLGLYDLSQGAIVESVEKTLRGR
jgi:magnesium chelatase subunit D